jgi:hypothetical protein
MVHQGVQKYQHLLVTTGRIKTEHTSFSWEDQMDINEQIIHFLQTVTFNWSKAKENPRSSRHACLKIPNIFLNQNADTKSIDRLPFVDNIQNVRKREIIIMEMSI